MCLYVCIVFVCVDIVRPKADYGTVFKEDTTICGQRWQNSKRQGWGWRNITGTVIKLIYFIHSLVVLNQTILRLMYNVSCVLSIKWLSLRGFYYRRGQERAIMSLW